MRINPHPVRPLGDREASRLIMSCNSDLEYIFEQGRPFTPTWSTGKGAACSKCGCGDNALRNSGTCKSRNRAQQSPVQPDPPGGKGVCGHEWKLGLACGTEGRKWHLQEWNAALPFHSTAGALINSLLLFCDPPPPQPLTSAYMSMISYCLLEH